MQLVRLLVSGLVLASLASATWGQGNPTAKLGGRVTSGGMPVAGVTVTVDSANLQGTRSTVTSGNGDYLFPALPPGEYDVSFELEGMQTLTLRARLSAAQASTLDAQMDVAAVEEEIVVTGNYEISGGSQASTTYSQALIEDLPVGRAINDIVALTPGVKTTGPIKAAGQGAISVGGAVSFENLYMVNGVVVNENLRGGAMDLFIEDAIQETTTATSGVSAEYGRFSGGVVNVITKSGGNTFSGSLRTSFTNQKWEEKTPLTTVQTDDVIPVYEATLGGPALRDRLWFFLAGRDFERLTTTNTSVTNIPYSTGQDEQRYEGKLTFSPSVSHTFVGSYMKLDELQPGNAFTPIMDLRSVYDRETPEELLALNYTGALTSNLFVTGQYSEREFAFIGSGSRFTDRIFGTLLLDRSRNNSRYWSPTFCGVCSDELRNNENALLKASYFLSSESLGSHDLVAGYDWFNDIRRADNHQSGSDYRVLGTSAILQGGEIYPVFNNNGSTIIQFNPIAQESRGTNFETHSMFVNDSWRVGDSLTASIGVRYDRNDGANAAGATVVDDAKISPRLALAWDPLGGDAVFHLSYGTYVAAIANSQADASSVGGSPATYQWLYRGPNINTTPGAPLVGPEEALAILFGWFDAAGGPFNGLAPSSTSIPGVNLRIGDDLKSPSVDEIALGGSFRIADRGLLRVDVVRRDYADFYAERLDLTTGQVINPATGRPVDLRLVENNDSLYERYYNGVHTQFRFPINKIVTVGGNYSWSQAKGNFEGENRGSGPIRATGGVYPEYLDLAWNSPEGYLSVDQRHRASLYGIFTIFDTERQSLRGSLLGSYGSGLPYSAIGNVRTAAFVANPGYASPPANVTYYFSDRGEFRTPDVYRVDLSLNYSVRLGRIELFIAPEVINVTDEQRIDTTDTAFFNTQVFTQDNTGATSCNGAPCQGFDPFTTAPVEGVHWAKGPNFGAATNPNAFQQPRTYRFSVGLRF